MRRSVTVALALTAASGCMSGPRTGTPPARTPATTPAPGSSARAAPPAVAAAAETSSPAGAIELSRTRPVMYGVPLGWTNLLRASRDEVEAQAPGAYDQAREVAARNGYSVLAMPLDPASPDAGSQMIELHLGVRRPVDQALLDDFVAHNNLGLTPDVIVERKLLAVGGRPIIKVRAEYAGATMPIDTLTYLYPVDSGEVRQLVFIVHADRYAALRPQLEAIEGGDPAQRAVQDQILEQYEQQRRARGDAADQKSRR